jgi:oligopeptidase A
VTNPLLKHFDLPPFSKIKFEHILPAITEALDECREVVCNTLEQNKSYTWDNLVHPLAELDNRLNCIFSPISHLNSVQNSAELRHIYEKAILLVSEYSTWVSQHKGLYQAYCSISEDESFNRLHDLQRKVVENILRDFRLSGVNLEEKNQSRYKYIAIRLSELSLKFSNNVLDATMSWSKLITEDSRLAGIPQSFLVTAKELAQAKGETGWLFTLDSPSYSSVIAYCDDAELRKEMYHAYSTRASDHGPDAGKWDNYPIMKEEISLRHELAQLLGFNSFAEKSLLTKMAESPSQVIDFLSELGCHTRPYAEQELSRLVDFARKEYGCKNIEPWDLSYFIEKQKQHLYNINDEDLRPYFPEKTVLDGLFELSRRIYGIEVKESKKIDSYHEDVKFFDIFGKDGQLYGSFYLDLYARENKRSGAWMDDCKGKMRKTDGSLQKPVAYLVCNFKNPVDKGISLLSHNEVVVLFHEFGHGLHHILTSIEVLAVSGINGVPWDAVELPSQLMENWCWEPEVLNLISNHYETGKKIPEEWMNKMLAAKNHNSALFIMRQLELALFDLHLHTDSYLHLGSGIFDTLRKVREQVGMLKVPEWNRFQNTFSHIFSGGYAAGYYSYLWSDVLAADAYSRFQEEGIFNHDVGISFLKNILSLGGSEDPMNMFKRFRGRKPEFSAMLKSYGIEK